MAKPSTGLKSISEGSSDIFKIDPRKLKIKNGWNNRDFSDPSNIQHVQELGASIAEVGVKEPLTVVWEEGEAWVTDGECRLRGTMFAINTLKAEIKTVPCKAEDRYASEAERLFSQFVRNSGKPFTILENAALFKRLLDKGWNQTEIAKRSGISAARVSQILDYNTMPEGIKESVLAGIVAPTTAMQTIKDHGSKAEQVLKKGMELANEQGKTKVTTAHVAEVTGAPKPNIKNAVIEAFESSDIDDSDEDIVIVKFPVAQWEILREILKL